jgi:tetratricopeptide (TPR) repeat protein
MGVLAIFVLLFTACVSTPQTTEAFLKRGIKFACKGKYEKAIADYTQAIRLDPNNAVAYNNRGYDRAIADYEAVLLINPNNTRVKKLLKSARQHRGGDLYESHNYIGGQ